MMDPKERVIPDITANYLYQESLSRYNFALNFIKKNSKILDAGCGTGYGSKVLSTSGEVIGIDNSTEAIKYAIKNYGQHARFRKMSLQDINFKSESFDAICFFEVIEHLKKPERILKKLRSILTKTGMVFISTPNKIYPDRIPESVSPYHVKEYSYSELKSLLKKVFGKVEVYGQNKTAKSKTAFKEFLESQKARQRFVDSDYLGLRKLIPRGIKELGWNYIGKYFGSKRQNILTQSDYTFDKKKINECEYFFAVYSN